MVKQVDRTIGEVGDVLSDMLSVVLSSIPNRTAASFAYQHNRPWIDAVPLVCVLLLSIHALLAGQAMLIHVHTLLLQVRGLHLRRCAVYDAPFSTMLAVAVSTTAAIA